MKLVKNNDVEAEQGTNVYCQESYAQELYNRLMDNETRMPTTIKDFSDNDLLLITGVSSIGKTDIEFEVNNSNTISIDLNKEKKFMNMYNLDIEEFLLWVKGDTENFLKEKSYIYITNDTHGIKGSLSKGLAEKMKHEFFKQITKQSTAYIATVLSKNRGGFLVDIFGVEAFLPGSLAAPNKIVDFDQFIGTKVNVMIEDYLKSIGTFIVSNKKYIKHILPIKIKELDTDKKYVGVVTDTAKFGIFIEIEEFFTGLLHTSKMDEETLQTFRNREFNPHSTIDVYIKEINEKNKIVFTSYTPEKQREIDIILEKEKEADRKEAEENAFKVNESYDGLITSIKLYGAFARIWNGKKTVTGLILNKDQGIEIHEGDKMKITIKNAEDGKYFFEI